MIKCPTSSEVTALQKSTRKGKRYTEDTSKKKDKPDEDKLLIYKNDLVRGVVDKAQFGDYGMIHTVQELYGSNVAGNLLSALSRLFTTFLQVYNQFSSFAIVMYFFFFLVFIQPAFQHDSYLFRVFQMHGFTCGVDDLMLTEGKDVERMNQLNSCEIIGNSVHREFIRVKNSDNIGNLNKSYFIQII